MRISTVPAFGAIVEHISDDEVCIIFWRFLESSVVERGRIQESRKSCDFTAPFCARGHPHEIFNVVQFVKCKLPRGLKAIFHCSRFAHAGEATGFNLVKNQSRGHAKKVKCSSTSKRVCAHKTLRQKTLRLDTLKQQ